MAIQSTPGASSALYPHRDTDYAWGDDPASYIDAHRRDPWLILADRREVYNPAVLDRFVRRPFHVVAADDGSGTSVWMGTLPLLADLTPRPVITDCGRFADWFGRYFLADDGTSIVCQSDTEFPASSAWHIALPPEALYHWDFDHMRPVRVSTSTTVYGQPAGLRIIADITAPSKK